jgi:hypothetical protein
MLVASPVTQATVGSDDVLPQHEYLVPQVRAGFAAPRCAVKGASNPARWGALHSVLPLHWEKPGADFGFLLLDSME